MSVALSQPFLEEDEGLTNEEQWLKSTKSSRCLCLTVSFLTNCFVGLLYIYPVYSCRFEHLLTNPNSQLVVLGVASQFSLAASQLPLGHLYNSCSAGKCGIKGTDRVFSLLATALQVVPCAVIAWFMIVGGVDNGAPASANFWLLFVAIVLYGCGNGAAFGHGMWTNGANFKHNIKLKSTVIAAISLAQGVGAIVMTVVYPYTFDLLDDSGDGNDTVSVADPSSSPFSSIVVFFFFQTAAYLLLGVGRFFWTYRIQQPQKLDDFSSEPEKVVAPKIDCGKLWRSDVVWYTCVCSFFGVGLGGAFGSLLGVAAEDYVLTEHNIAILSDNLALTFLSGQVLGRLLATFTYRFAVIQSKLLTVFIGLELVGLLLFLFLPEQLLVLYVASVIIGTGFGGILCTLGPIVAAHFPGGNKGLFPVLFGIVLLFPSVGLLAIGQGVGALTPTSDVCWTNSTNTTGTGTTAGMVPAKVSFYNDCRFLPTALMSALAIGSTIVAALLWCSVASQRRNSVLSH